MRPWILIGGALSIAKNQVAVVFMHRPMIGRKIKHKRMHESTYVYNTGGYWCSVSTMGTFDGVVHSLPSLP